MLNLKLKIARPTDLTFSLFRGSMAGAFILAVACTMIHCPHTAQASDDQGVLEFERISSQIERSEVDGAIALGNLDALNRIDKASRLKALYDAMIETERARMVLRESMARRRVAAMQRAATIDNATAQSETDPESRRRVQVTTYQESDDNATERMVTLLRPKKVGLNEPTSSATVDHDLGYRPLVVARPPADHVQSSSAEPVTKIDVAKAANVRREPLAEKTENRVSLTNPASTSQEGVNATQSPLESVVIDDSLASNQTVSVVDSVDKTASLPQPPPFPQLPPKPAAPPETIPAVVVADLPSTALPIEVDDVTELDSTTIPSAPSGQLQPTTETVSDASRDSLTLEMQFVDAASSNLPSEQPETTETSENRSTPTPTLITSPAQPAAAPQATLAMQWPFTVGGQLGGQLGGQRDARLETLPTPQGGSDVTLSVDDVDVRTVLEMLAKSYKMNILVANDVEGTVTANVSGLTPEQTLNSVVRMCGLSIQRDDNVILVYPRDNLPRESRQLRVFPLDFARSELVEPTVTGLLSSIGSAYSSTVDELDNRKGREAIVVIDTPEVLEQVESYIIQADQPPRQVMIEARVLEIELRDEMEHGVNFEHLLGGEFRTGGFRITDNIATSTNPFFFAEIDSKNLDALITMLETTTDAKTLATPRVMVVNGQNAKIQVGQQLGFAVATVTQTSTIQDVRYLDTGVVLQVTPTISRDNRVLLNVKPKVSSGAINPETLLPEETTREVETSVMLGNHQGMIIGGLIQEDDRVVIKKMPWLGDVKYVGKLFQRRETSRARTEIIVALIPHIIESCEDEHCSVDDPIRKQIEWERTENRLFNGPLNRECRPWEPRLPDVTGETGFHRDIDRLRNVNPYGKGCEPIKTGLLSTD
ncbi:MAG: hypothetical protein KDB00_28995 [Planctomycetales bacterium]|nr:hypothetical protein [Planctomycetales bacterium]